MFGSGRPFLGPPGMSASALLLRDKRTSSVRASVVAAALSTAICSGLPVLRAKMHPPAMGTKSRETIYGASVRAAAEQAAETRKRADRLACEAWNKRVLAFKGPAQPSPTLGDALNAGLPRSPCLGCNNQTVRDWLV
jgi:hypothetical protein